jgi:hypothetical protein
VADIHDAFEASVVAGKFGEEFLDRKSLNGTGLFADLAGTVALTLADCNNGGTPMPLCIGHLRTCVKGIVPERILGKAWDWNHKNLEMFGKKACSERDAAEQAAARCAPI